MPPRMARTVPSGWSLEIGYLLVDNFRGHKDIARRSHRCEDIRTASRIPGELPRSGARMADPKGFITGHLLCVRQY